ncbi:MAG: hypothetical protein PHD81_00100 [Candidatus Nanoarchaeia archaeon]|nr:hypothetical protein [Candidatus Nanoarchaeia archaeon]MDD5587493.1 hypothetical protein [Candidatus Nanoarchaeia archaeon]
MYFKQLIIVLSVFLIVILNVNASIISETNEVSLCPENTHLFLDIIKNDGNSEQQYTVDLYGSALPWSASIPKGFVLKPGDIRSIYTYVTPMSNTPPGKYDLYIDVVSGSSLEKAHHSIIINDCNIAKPTKISQPTTQIQTQKPIIIEKIVEVPKIIEKRVVVEKPVIKTVVQEKPVTIKNTTKTVKVKPNYNFTVYIDRNYADICDHSQDIIPIIIENTGDEINKFDISKDAPKWVHLDKKSLIIPAKTSQKFNLILEPDYNIKGIFDVKLTIDPDKGNTKAKGIIKAEVKSCNFGEVAFLSKKEEICSPVTDTFTATIKNSGSIANTYTLSLDAPEFIIFNTKTVTVSPGQEEVVLLKVNNSFIKPGTYKFKLESTLSSKVKSSDEMELVVLTEKQCSGESTNETGFDLTNKITGYYTRAKNYVKNIINKEPVNETSCAPEDLAPITGMLNTKTTEKLADLDLAVGDEESFDYNDEEHIVTLNSIENESVLIAINSNKTNYVLLTVGNSKFVDITDDGISDIEVKLNSIEDEIASLTINKFTKIATTEKDTGKKLIDLMNKYKYYIIVAFILLFLIIIIIKTKFHKKAESIFSEEVETELMPIQQTIPSVPLEVQEETHDDTPWEDIVQKFEKIGVPKKKVVRKKVVKRKIIIKKSKPIKRKVFKKKKLWKKNKLLEKKR